MGVYSRFKRGPEGFRALVELLESTPIERRQRMIEVGMAEDAQFTEKVLQFLLTFDDVTRLPDPQLAEVIAATPPRTTAFALINADAAVIQRFMKNATRPVAEEIEVFLEAKASLREIGGARLKLIEVARKLERKGLVRVKRIPGG